MKQSVFVSYSSDTRPLAEELARALAKEGIGSWAAFKDIRPGERSADQLERAACEADWFVILVRTNGPSSHWQEAEWQRALISTWDDPRKRILPVLFGSGKVQAFGDWVPLQILDSTASPNWTMAVLQALQSGDRRSHREDNAESHFERETRFKELESAVDELWNIEVNERPVAKV